MNSITWASIIVLGGATSALLIKYYANTRYWYLVPIIILIVLVNIYCYIRLYSVARIGSTYTMISISTILLVLLAAYIFYKERINTVQILGVALLVIGLLFLGFGDRLCKNV